MSISASLLPEFDHEMAHTKKFLERLPDDKLDFKPHEKSWTMGELATHLANLPSWAVQTFEQESLDFAPPGGDPIPPLKAAASCAEILEMFEKNVAAARSLLESADDEKMMGIWTLLSGGQEIFSMPRVAVFRSFILSHMIHHRAQLGVYLRMNDVPVPGPYGPSADEA